MPITRTPIHDDDGSGTTGTIIDNAWKQELYGQIDAADAAGAASAPAILAKRSGGPNTGTGYVNLDTQVMPPLGVNDTLQVVVTLWQGTAAGASLYLATNAAQLLRFDDLGTSRPMNAGEYGLWTFTLHEPMVDATSAQILAVGGIVGQPGGIRPGKGSLGGSLNWNTGGWLLCLASGAQAAGGTQYWSWTVSRL